MLPKLGVVSRHKLLCLISNSSNNFSTWSRVTSRCLARQFQWLRSFWLRASLWKLWNTTVRLKPLQLFQMSINNSYSLSLCTAQDKETILSQRPKSHLMRRMMRISLLPGNFAIWSQCSALTTSFYSFIQVMKLPPFSTSWKTVPNQSTRESQFSRSTSGSASTRLSRLVSKTNSSTSTFSLSLKRLASFCS